MTQRANRLDSRLLAMGSWALLATVVLILGTGCSDEESNPDTLPCQGITEVDSLGQILSVDLDDWCWEMSGVLFTSHLSIAPDQISFVADSVGHVLATSIRCVNVSDEAVHIDSVSVSDPFSVAPESATIQPGAALELIVTYTQPDEGAHADTLTIATTPAQGAITIPLSGELEGGVNPVPDLSFQFLPAYPNPSGGEVELRYVLPGTRHVILKISACHSVLYTRELVDAMQQASIYRVTWDGRDEEGNLVPAGMYEARLTAGAESCAGDIQIVR